MTRYKLTIEYDGRDFVGWQRQDNGPSVQAALEEAVARFCGETVAAQAAGRTDSGVHALGQVAHVDIAKETDTETVRDALNFHLKPAPVAVLQAEAVSDDFHARFSAIGRRYLYRIVSRRAPLALDRGRAWFVPRVRGGHEARHGHRVAGRGAGRDRLERTAVTRRAASVHADVAGALAAAAGARRVVLANGCFDPLHVGHVRYLADAAAHGDFLVVAVNDDAGTRRLKGAGRPVVPARDRAAVVAALACVDAVLLFGDDTVARILRELRPAVHAKGTDYTRDTVPEREVARELGVETVIAGDPKTHASREVVERIRGARGGR